MRKSIEFDELLKTAGVSLQNPGLTEVGLRRADALHAVNILRNARLAILGGEVYLHQKERVRPWSPNSWHVDPKPREDRETYLRRTWDQAENYISLFPTPADGEPLFVIAAIEVPGT